MATFAVLDNKQLPNYAIVGDSPETDERYPLRMFLKEGYFNTGGLLVIGGTVDLVVTPPRDWKPAEGIGWGDIVCVIGDIIVTPYHMTQYADGFDSSATARGEATQNYHFTAGKRYRFRFSLVSTTSLTLRIFDDEAGGEREQFISLTAVGIPDGVPLTLGYPTQNIRDAVIDSYAPFYIPEGLIYHSFGDMVDVTGISLFPGTVDTAWAKPLRSVGKFIVSHPTDKDGFRIYFTTSGGGGADNGLFEIRGDELYAKAQLTAGMKYIKVRVRDKYNWNGVTVPLVLGVGVAAPTDIVLDFNNIEAGGGVTGVGTLTTVDADPGDVFVYTFVAGAGDTDNALFEIAGAGNDELHFITPPTDIATYSVRIRSTDATGSYREEAFTVNSIDTVAPTLVTIEMTAVSNTYTIPVVTWTATHTPDVGEIYYIYLPTGEGRPEANDPRWVTPAPTEIVVPVANRVGGGMYTFDFYLRDESGNIDPGATTSVEITDTEAPVLTAFTASDPAANSYEITVTDLVYSDSMCDNSLLQVCYTLSALPPLANDSRWHTPIIVNGQMQDTFTLEVGDQNGIGSYPINAWIKDTSDNISTKLTSTVNITDAIAPVVTIINIAHVSSSYQIDVGGPTYAIVATDDPVGGTAAYFLGESDVTPPVLDPGWIAADGDHSLGATTYTFTNQQGSGDYTLYVWAKDASGNISASANHVVTITI